MILDLHSLSHTHIELVGICIFNTVTYTDNQVPPQDPGPYPQALIIETYTPPDPGPYPQDQPKQNSVRFTPTQVNSALDLNHILSLFMHNDFSFNLSLPSCFPHNS